MHFVYIVECRDHSYYTGYTSNLHQRLNAHNSGKGAKYTRARLPVHYIYCSSYANKSAAMSEEYRIKQLPRKEKIALIQSMKNEISFLL